MFNLFGENDYGSSSRRYRRRKPRKRVTMRRHKRVTMRRHKRVPTGDINVKAAKEMLARKVIGMSGLNSVPSWVRSLRGVSGPTMAERVGRVNRVLVACKQMSIPLIRKHGNKYKAFSTLKSQCGVRFTKENLTYENIRVPEYARNSVSYSIPQSIVPRTTREKWRDALEVMKSKQMPTQQIIESFPLPPAPEPVSAPAPLQRSPSVRERTGSVMSNLQQRLIDARNKLRKTPPRPPPLPTRSSMLQRLVQAKKGLRPVGKSPSKPKEPSGNLKEKVDFGSRRYRFGFTSRRMSYN